jgi:superfamily II DNA/RNA helicase
LTDPVEVLLGGSEIATNVAIVQRIERVSEGDRLTKCIGLLQSRPDAKVLIFARTKRSADDVADNLLAKGLTAFAVHGDKPQSTRDGLLRQFREADAGILVATDLASRGIDIADIDIVVNYEFPADVETYVHRIGRTGRAGREGLAITFFADENAPMSRKLVRAMQQAEQEIPEWLLAMATAAPREGKRSADRRAF